MCRAVARSENLGGHVILSGDNVPPSCDGPVYCVSNRTNLNAISQYFALIVYFVIVEETFNSCCEATPFVGGLTQENLLARN